MASKALLPLAAVLVAGTAGCITSSVLTDPAPMGPMAFEPLGAGSGNLAAERTAKLASRAQLAVFWREACQPGEPRPPAVDFQRRDVLALFVGIRPSTGYVVEVVEVERTGRALDVRATESQPGEKCAGGAATTYPNAFVAVDKTRLPMRFTFQRAARACA
jgi:hypothetical protein